MGQYLLLLTWPDSKCKPYWVEIDSNHLCSEGWYLWRKEHIQLDYCYDREKLGFYLQFSHSIITS